MALKDVGLHYEDVLALGAALPPVSVPIHEGRGLTLAADVAARFSIPPFTNSAMDGFAVRVEDVAPGVEIPVVGDIAAGATGAQVLSPGTSLRIMTGAPLPTNADAVLQVELTEHPERNMLRLAPTSIVPTAVPGRGAHIRLAGEDIRAGDIGFVAGTRLSPAHLAALVAIGHSEVRVHARPRVGVVTTGDELRAPGEELALGQIPDSNSMLVTQLVTEAGALAATIPCHTDTTEAFVTGLRGLADSVDLVITTGGVSAGAFDVVKAALLSEGVTFDKVSMQPGKPQGFGLVSGDSGCRVPVVCLPGNPVSVFVSWHLFVRPLLDVLFGRPVPTHDGMFHLERVGAAWSRKPGRSQFLPCTLGDDGVVPASAGGSKSHLIAALPRATGLARVPADVADVRVGDTVDVMWFRDCR